MPRSRLVSPGFFKNETLAILPYEARLCFIGLWTIADREGRLEDRPMRIRAEVFPYDNVNVESLLATLEQHGFIVRYEIDAKRYIDIPAFLVYQKPHPRETPSSIPGRPSHTLGKPKASLGQTLGTPRSVSPAVSVSVSVSESVSDPKDHNKLISSNGNGHNGSSAPLTQAEKDHATRLAMLEAAKHLQGKSHHVSRQKRAR